MYIVHADTDDPSVRTLIELHQQTGEDFWDDAAQSFFNTAGKAVFGLPAEIWEQLGKLES